MSIVSTLPESAVELSNSADAKMPAMLIVGDPAGLNIAREALVELELGWEVVFASGSKEALAITAVRDLDVVLIDLGDPSIDGVDLVDDLHTKFPNLAIVLMSAPYAVSVALEAMRKGANNHFPRELLDREPASVLDVLREAAQAKHLRRQAQSVFDTQYLQFTIDNDRKKVTAVVSRLQSAILEMGVCDRSALSRIGVAYEESLLNAVIHGNLEVTSELRQDGESAYDRVIEERRRSAPYCRRSVSVTAKVSRDEAVVVIEDQGKGFNVSAVPDPTLPENLGRIGGRGMLLIRSFMTSVHYNEIGNRITLVKRRG